MSFRKTFSSLVRKTVDWNQNADFFNFTRGRFVAREAKQMAQRHIKFNMNELCRIAGKSLGKKCVNVEKCADGMYNKAFLLTMDDQQQVVAKVPNPNAGQPHFTTASEVATMDFMRNVLNTPAPRVIAWSSNNKNAVEAEYIIMEKAEGVQLASVWPKLEGKQKVQVIRSVADFQLAWADALFNQIGSLYYKEDLQGQSGAAPLYVDGESGETIESERFAIGPIQNREWMDHGRAQLDCDRGPWSSAESYKRAEIERDLRAVRSRTTLPRPLSMLCGPSLYQPNREKKLRAGHIASQALPHVLACQERTSPFAIWHDDLHPENIFVREENPAEVLAVIDWQSTAITPLFDHTIVPAFMDCNGPAVQGTERPSLPELPEDASNEDWSAASALFEEQTIVSGFKHLLKNSMPAALDALLFQESEAYHVLNACRSLLENSEAYCLASIVNLEGAPVELTEAELAEMHRDLEATQDSVHIMKTIEKSLGDLFPERGIVRHDQYQDSKAALRRVKQQVIEDFSKSDEDRRVWAEEWPFDD